MTENHNFCLLFAAPIYSQAPNFFFFSFFSAACLAGWDFVYFTKSLKEKSVQMLDGLPLVAVTVELKWGCDLSSIKLCLHQPLYATKGNKLGKKSYATPRHKTETLRYCQSLVTAFSDMKILIFPTFHLPLWCPYTGWSKDTDKPKSASKLIFFFQFS